MALAAEDKSQSALAQKGGSALLRILAAATLMAVAANCFLKYLWWTACYSAWSGIPKLAEQWKAAGTRASLNGWSFIILEALSIAVLATAIRVRISMRILASVAITLAGTALFALILSWIKQGLH